MRILFASMPFDGHFLPLTGLADHLRKEDTTSASTRARATPSDSPSSAHRTSRSAARREVNGENLAEHFPEIEKLKGPRRIAFDLEKIFFGNTKAHFDDIREIRAEFPFEALVADGAFYAAYLVARKLGGPGLRRRARSHAGSDVTHGTAAVLRSHAGDRPARRAQAPRHPRDGREHHETRHGDVQRAARARRPPALHAQRVRSAWDAATLFFQTGVPEMDFPRERLACQPPVRRPAPAAAHARAGRAPIRRQARQFPSAVVVSQGTVDNRDPEKLLVPALTALAGRRPPRRRLHRPKPHRRPASALPARQRRRRGLGRLRHAPPSRRPLHLQRRLREHHARADERGADPLGRQARRPRTTSTPASPTAASASTSRPSARSPARSRPASSGCSATRVQAERRTRRRRTEGAPAARDDGGRHRRETAGPPMMPRRRDDYTSSDHVRARVCG